METDIFEYVICILIMYVLICLMNGIYTYICVDMILNHIIGQA